MSTYRNSRRDVQVADDYNAQAFRCTVCGKQTDRDDMATFGARCRECFRGYCNELNRDIGSVKTREDKLEILAWLRSVFEKPQDPKAWAHRLREKEESGQHVPPLQRRMWREALREPKPDTAMP